MEKIRFTSDELQEETEDTSAEEEKESIYEIVEDEKELSAILKVFEELLEDIEIER